MIQANCRTRFTAEDFNFIVRTLSRNEAEAVSLVDLLTDTETRDEVLDHETLIRAVLENPGNLTISPHFYFYVLARLALKRSGIDDRLLADYVAALLETFSRSRHLHAPIENLEAPYLSDLLLALKGATPYQSFLIRAHVGNYSLFITGIFHESIERRSQRGAPSCSFYEDMGRTNFHAVASHQVAKQFELNLLFETLADRFHECRVALNRLAEEFVDLGDNRYLPTL